MIVAYIFLSCYINQEIKLAEYLRKFSVVDEIMITAGDNDIICRVVMDNLDELYQFTITVLEKRDEIKTMRTSVVTKEITS